MTRLISAGLAVILVLGACTTINPYTGDTQTAKATKGALIGAGVGVLAGIITGDDARERRKRALIGAGIGAIAGGSVGYYMDVKEAKLRQELANTGIVFERQGDRIVMAMPGNVTFDVNKAEIKGQFYPVLDRLAKIFNEHDQTFIEVAGHTDNTGSDAVNIPLSENRARSVASYLAGKNVERARLAELGMGSAYPIADNNTAEGRQLNRRVEITIVPIT
ncbi:MAG: OmpA family protein [Gammaproteobacteria bacterium]|nr:OmpA family protein [Gammaproteobacteria bacterium]